MKRLICLLGCLVGGISAAQAGVDPHFKFVFGTNNTTDQRVHRMKPEVFYRSKLQVDFVAAVGGRNTNKMTQLLEKGGDVNQTGLRGMQPIFWALINESKEGVSFLLRNGADANAVVTSKLPAQDNALTLAVSLKDRWFCETLLKHGAKPNATVHSSRTTPLFEAAFYRRAEMISILLTNGADINWQASNGDTALHASVRQGAYAIASQLYRAGADPLIKTSYGASAVDSLTKFGGRFFIKRSDRADYLRLCDTFIQAGLISEADVRR